MVEVFLANEHLDREELAVFLIAQGANVNVEDHLEVEGSVIFRQVFGEEKRHKVSWFLSSPEGFGSALFPNSEKNTRAEIPRLDESQTALQDAPS